MIPKKRKQSKQHRHGVGVRPLPTNSVGHLKESCAASNEALAESPQNTEITVAPSGEYQCSKHGDWGDPNCIECVELLQKLVSDKNGYLTGDLK